MSLSAVAAVIAFFTVGFYLLRWVHRKSTVIRLPKVAPGQWDPLVANYSQGVEDNPFREEYEKLMEQAGDAPTNAQRTALAQSLMRRTMFNVERIMEMQDQKSTLQALMKSGSIGEDVWLRFQHNESTMSEELSAVGAEAERLKPGWSTQIFQQAQQLLMMEKRRQAEAERERMEAEEAGQRKRMELSSQSDSQEELRAREVEAERLARELIEAEEREKKNKAAAAGGKGGRKKSK